jgi:UDP-N-acetylmuramate dehydrogenase
MTNLKDIVKQYIKQCGVNADVRFNEPMSKHTTFRIGGPADCWLCPHPDGNYPDSCAALLGKFAAKGIPVFILGGGANILVSDSGIRGIVLDTTLCKGSTVTAEGLCLKSGTSLDTAAEIAANAGLSGLEFLAGMPGCVGGALWMNARCYGSEIADVFLSAQVIDYGEKTPQIIQITGKNGFAYKKSPFQGKKQFIVSVNFTLSTGDEQAIRSKMEQYRRDREDKGHYLFPCAGSAFKNNHEFGKPTGRIIDELGLRGFTIGGAQIAPFHGNIVINTGNASAVDVRAVMDAVAAKVKATTGFTLDPEIIFIE